MESAKVQTKKNLFVKTWERCRSIPVGREKKSPSKPSSIFSKSKSCHYTTTKSSSKDDNQRNTKSRQVAPEGCFSVYVGPEKQRFVIKTKFANHPLFRMLLEDAEMEYGYNSEGPLLLPCEVDLFYKVLAEMDSKEIVPSCGFAYGSCSPFNPSRRLGNNNNTPKVYGSYGLLTPSRLLKMNHF
ncbi:hypothetical protein HYC85_028851 [Camellia sinensis]|uniref:Uncharacterized protein n=1 Tax=Camellia sinensis TaxID=4442 RepID=A0A7J7FW93_CAMSI|nr:hypothetical protein HYC85_028851 [Camellia sinensis]